MKILKELQLLQDFQLPNILIKGALLIRFSQDFPFQEILLCLQCYDVLLSKYSLCCEIHPKNRFFSLPKPDSTIKCPFSKTSSDQVHCTIESSSQQSSLSNIDSLQFLIKLNHQSSVHGIINHLIGSIVKFPVTGIQDKQAVAHRFSVGPETSIHPKDNI